MAYRLPKTVKRSFVNYSHESKLELEELSKLKLMVASGRYKDKKIFVSIDKPKVIEIRIYDLSNFSDSIYSDFNKRVKKLIK